MEGKYKVFAERSFNRGSLGIWIGKECGKRFYVAEPVIFSEKQDHEYRNPTIELPYNDDIVLQALVDQAWDLGIRPRYAKADSSEINAVKYHLEDMRLLALGKKRNKA